MRIGIDMLAVQSPHHGHRGIGRYAANLVNTLLTRRDGHEYVLYVHEGLSDGRVPSVPGESRRVVRADGGKGESVSSALDRLVRTNPDALDAFVVLSAIERWQNYSPPAVSGSKVKLAAVVHDLIPFLFPDESAVDPVLMRHYRVLENISRYDVLLTISAATRRDCISVLNTPPDRIVEISSASDAAFFKPDPARHAPPAGATRETLRSLGIDRPFVLNVGGLDPRKNTYPLVDAFAALPEPVRRSYQLVLTFSLDHWERGRLLKYAREIGLGDGLVVTDVVSDETLLRLYQRCAAFAFPSAYEGFGLPILEAMHCGAAVVVGNNSSQMEVVGNAGLLADVSDVGDVSAKLARVLTDDRLRADLSARALEQSARFSWSRTADLFLGAIAGPRPSRRVRFDRGHAKKPTIAFFSPLPPRKSGISDYSAFLLEQLRETYRVDLYHDAGYVPEPALASAEYSAADYRLFDRVAAAKEYHAVVYQMGNSRYHSYMFDVMARHPGVVTLHDFCLADFHLHHGNSRGLGRSFIRDELLRWHPEDRAEIEAAASAWPEDGGLISRNCAGRGWYLNRGVLDACRSLVVHSPWCRERVRETTPWQADKVVVIPHGIHTRCVTAGHRAAVRDRYGIAADALVFASFGFVHPDKMNPQALEVFAEVASADPRAVYLFVGENADGGEARGRSASLGLNDRVRFLGRQPAEAFLDLMAATDVGVNLRLPPTNGETSGALLNLLTSGVPTVATSVTTFADYPDHVVRKVKWETEGIDGLRRAARELASDPSRRGALGRAAQAYVTEHHDWPKVAEMYVDAIERCHADGSTTRKPRLPRTSTRVGAAY